MLDSKETNECDIITFGFFYSIYQASESRYQIQLRKVIFCLSIVKGRYTFIRSKIAVKNLDNSRKWASSSYIKVVMNNNHYYLYCCFSSYLNFNSNVDNINKSINSFRITYKEFFQFCDCFSHFIFIASHTFFIFFLH